MPVWEQNQLNHLYLLQIDLANHSKWVSSLGSDPDATEQRAEFAEKLKLGLVPYGFERAFWAGDGGVFFTDDKHDIKDTIGAIDETYSIFSIWKARYENRRLLNIRITVHVDQIYTHKEPGYWYSETYNAFLKHERKFGITGSAVITEQVRKRMSNAAQERWVKYSRVTIDNQLWTLYRDNTKVQEIDGQTFVHWLNNSAFNEPEEKAKHFKEGSILATCGETIIIAMPLTFEGFKSDVELIEEAFDSSNWAITPDKLGQTTKKNDFQKLSPVNIAVPMTDDRTLRIYYTNTNYSFASGFHKHVTENENEWNEYKKYANCTGRLSKNIPTIFVGHNSLIIVDQSSSKEYVVLSQRKVNDKQLDYFSGAWSVSFEEQFRPIKMDKEEKDKTLEDCIIRGLGEEFNYFGSYEDIQVQSIFIEALNLNIAFLGYTKIRTSIEDFKTEIPKAKDYAESESVILIERNKANLENCLTSPFLPTQLLDEALFMKNTRENVKEINRFDWHPTSKLRLANLLWEKNYGN
jgi:hypothetical protein